MAAGRKCRSAIRFLSTYVSRSPLQRKSIGALPDSEQQVLFGSTYDRKQSLDLKPAAHATRYSITPTDLDAALENLHKLDASSSTSISLLSSALRKCSIAKDLERGLCVHQEMKRLGLLTNLFLSNLLINMYGKCGDLQSARLVFDSLSDKNKFSWSIIIAAYAQNGHSSSALDLYEKMVSAGEEIDDVLLATVIGSCASSGDLESGMKIHQRVINSNMIVHTALINMYGKCKRVDQAKRVFDRMPDKDVVSWNAMIAAFAQNGPFARDALVSSVVSACAILGAVAEGKEIHLMILKSGLKADVTLENTLLNMYAKCGCLIEARRLFDGIRRKSTITWSSMVSAYTQNGCHKEALELFKQMDSSANMKPNCITYSNALSACAGLGDLIQGKIIHERVMKENCHTAAVIGSALIHMYAKCSCLEEARNVFDDLSCKDLVCGNTMLAAYAQFGDLEQAAEVYRQMVVSGTDPSSITLIGLIIGASHAGRVEDGRSYFVDVVDHHRDVVHVLWEHYMCLIDLLGRSGWLKDAEELVGTMPYEPCVTGWITLLSACRIHGDVERAERAAEQVYELEPDEGAHAKLMLSTYQESGKKWDVMSLLRRKMFEER